MLIHKMNTIENHKEKNRKETRTMKVVERNTREVIIFIYQWK
jgi:hypothetical protein